MRGLVLLLATLTISFCVFLILIGYIYIKIPWPNITWTKLEFDIDLGLFGTYHVDTGLWVPTGITIEWREFRLVSGSEARELWNNFKNKVLQPIVNAIKSFIQVVQNAIVNTIKDLSAIFVDLGANPQLAQFWAVTIIMVVVTAIAIATARLVGVG